MSKKCNLGAIIAIVILGLILLLNIANLFKKDARTLETLKVGGSSNMKKIEQLYSSPEYISQQTMSIDQALSQMNIDENLNNNGLDDALVSETIINKLEEIKSSGVDYGAESARFTILEYSELLCPYCKRHSEQGTIEEVIKKYPDEVNTIFRNFIVHSQAAKLGEVVECVGELKREVKHDFIKKAFTIDEGIDLDALINVAGQFGINKNTLMECVDSNRYTQEVNNQTSEGRNLFGINGTPGNVIIDRETGKIVVIPGAYPVEKFIEEIENLKNN
ncbi:MAG: thioredoxin domain-containing protein [Candidatus Absconditabacterales bacterium]|nr:thioredoxin domain-containing protein [Candidatus Absconditabacterales bacterium]